jgi:beta-glucosidase-like glycosyl hydrolase/CubicO group peptidase (beta-lactamase class C family)
MYAGDKPVFKSIKNRAGKYITNPKDWVDSTFNSLTPDQRIAQLLMVAAYSNRDQAHISEISCLIETHNIGGIIFFQGGPYREAAMTNFFQSCTKTPLLIGIDGEWGLNMRLDSTLWFPRQMMLGAIENNRLIYDMGAEIANQMKALGIHINFAPVVDINNNPLNPVISNRSFGEDKYKVTEKAIQYMKGMQDNGLFTVAKHFPGHGDTYSDSHTSLPLISHSFQRIDSMELFPFRELIKNNVDGIMIAHLQIPSIDTATNTASTLSHNIVTKLLRDSLKFEGLIFTDALNMKGVSGFYAPGELEVKALQAGNDILLMPADVTKAISSIREAINQGILSQSQIDSSCIKVLRVKYKMGLNHLKPVNLAEINEKLYSRKAQAIQRKIVESAITLVKNTDEIIPLKNLDSLRIAVVLAGTDTLNSFTQALSLYKNFDCHYLPKSYDSARIDSFIYMLRHYNLLLVSVHNTSSLPIRAYGIKPATIAFIDTLASIKKTVLLLPATPYALSYFKNINFMQSVIVSYHDTPETQEKAAQLIFGGIPARGNLPVTASIFPYNTSWRTPAKYRLRYALPEELGISSGKLNQIDSIIESAIQQKAMPGCQVLAAKDGAVFYMKSFGFHTYDSLQPVHNTDIYDIASLTKIAGTLPAIMRLYENHDIKLKNKLSAYLHELKKTNKKDITLIDILTHQAGLQPYIPFYLNLLQPINAGEKLMSSANTNGYTIKISSTSYFNAKTQYKNNLITSKPDIEHGILVADDMYLTNSYTDSIFKIINNSDLLKEKQYKYSDLGFYYLYTLIERITKTSLNEYVDNNFYKKLGSETMGYLPMNKFGIDKIVPSEDDKYFRKQLVHGHVHDQGAAMLGGICGHAGVFSNANDLAKLMQMYLNKGSYGDIQFFEPSTVDYFTSCPFCETNNRRGIGFDKPDLKLKNGPTCQCVSTKSFGHQGFTGTYTWADPETGLLYVFLSNRVYPDASNNKLAELNVRTRILEVLTEAIK